MHNGASESTIRAAEGKGDIICPLRRRTAANDVFDPEQEKTPPCENSVERAYAECRTLLQVHTGGYRRSRSTRKPAAAARQVCLRSTCGVHPLFWFLRTPSN